MHCIALHSILRWYMDCSSIFTNFAFHCTVKDCRLHQDCDCDIKDHELWHDDDLDERQTIPCSWAQWQLTDEPLALFSHQYKMVPVRYLSNYLQFYIWSKTILRFTTIFVKTSHDDHGRCCFFLQFNDKFNESSIFIIVQWVKDHWCRLFANLIPVFCLLLIWSHWYVLLPSSLCRLLMNPSWFQSTWHHLPPWSLISWDLVQIVSHI